MSSRLELRGTRGGCLAGTTGRSFLELMRAAYAEQREARRLHRGFIRSLGMTGDSRRRKAMLRAANARAPGSRVESLGQLTLSETDLDAAPIGMIGLG
jgi:hypothetical protein